MHPAVFAPLAAHTLSRPSPQPSAAPRAAVPVSTPVATADRLYSLRERRRIANYLRLRFDEMREDGLDRAVEAIERRLPLESLTAAPPACPRSPGPP